MIDMVIEFGDKHGKLFKVIYKSGVAFTFRQKTLPKTVMDFIQNSQVQDSHYSSRYNRDEIIYQ